MDKKKKKPRKLDGAPIEPTTPVLTDVNTVVSSTECTGLTPNSVLSQEDAESYEDIYPITLVNEADNPKNGQ